MLVVVDDRRLRGERRRKSRREYKQRAETGSHRIAPVRHALIGVVTHDPHYGMRLSSLTTEELPGAGRPLPTDWGLSVYLLRGRARRVILDHGMHLELEDIRPLGDVFGDDRGIAVHQMP